MIGQKTEGAMPLGAVPARNQGSRRRDPPVGTMACETTAPLGVKRATQQTCRKPCLSCNVVFAGVPDANRSCTGNRPARGKVSRAFPFVVMTIRKSLPVQTRSVQWPQVCHSSTRIPPPHPTSLRWRIMRKNSRWIAIQCGRQHWDLSQGPIPAGTGETIAVRTSFKTPRAYPRRHGGNKWIDLLRYLQWGLSPQARGKPAEAFGAGADTGPIPAGTGETSLRQSDKMTNGAYPRRHGGNQGYEIQDIYSGGLSPQARGKHSYGTAYKIVTGPIPAGTGETQEVHPKNPLDRAYPRRHGGNKLPRRYPDPPQGLSPQARGKR